MTTDFDPSTIVVPDYGDFLPAYIKTAWVEEDHKAILDWVVFGPEDAEQAPEDTPEDRYHDFMVWCGQRKARWYVNTYFTHEAYGGPEEGGWWYTIHAPAEPKEALIFQPIGPFDDYVKACEVSAFMLPILRAQHPGEKSYTIVERHRARLYPRFKPHYC
jgi:hypothetical protein